MTLTFGNQKSSKINHLKDQYGRVVYNRHELYEMLYDGEDISNVEVVDWHEDFEKYNLAVEKNHLPNKLYKALDKMTLDVNDFDEINQNNWYMPDEYKDECSIQAYWNYYIGEKHIVANLKTEKLYERRPKETY